MFGHIEKPTIKSIFEHATVFFSLYLNVHISEALLIAVAVKKTTV